MEQYSSLLHGARRPAERCDSALAAAPNAIMGGHAGRTETGFAAQDRCFYIGGRAAGRFIRSLLADADALWIGTRRAADALDGLKAGRLPARDGDLYAGERSGQRF